MISGSFCPDVTQETFKIKNAHTCVKKSEVSVFNKQGSQDFSKVMKERVVNMALEKP